MAIIKITFSSIEFSRVL